MRPVRPVQPGASRTASESLVVIVTLTRARLTGPLHVHAWLVRITVPPFDGGGCGAGGGGGGGVGAGGGGGGGVGAGGGGGGGVGAGGGGGGGVGAGGGGGGGVGAGGAGGGGGGDGGDAEPPSLKATSCARLQSLASVVRPTTSPVAVPADATAPVSTPVAGLVDCAEED